MMMEWLACVLRSLPRRCASLVKHHCGSSSGLTGLRISSNGLVLFGFYPNFRIAFNLLIPHAGFSSKVAMAKGCKTPQVKFLCYRCFIYFVCVSGAWIKNQVARAMLLGGHIRTVRDFFEHCERFLTQEANNRSKKRKFTCRRIFYLVETKELAHYRKSLPKMKTWSGVRQNFAFWAGGEENVVCRKWLACVCSACMGNRHDECEQRALLQIGNVFYNASICHTLEPTHVSDRTKEEDIALSPEVCHCCMIVLLLALVTDACNCEVMQKANVGTVIATRPGRIVDSLLECGDEDVDEVFYCELMSCLT